MIDHHYVQHSSLDISDAQALLFLIAVLIFFCWSDSQEFWILLAVIAVVCGYLTAAVVFALLAVATMPRRR